MPTRDGANHYTYLPLKDYEALVDGVYRKCAQWLAGRLPGDRLVAMFSRVADKNYAIAELNGKPNSYDWSRTPVEYFERADRAEDRGAYTLMRVVSSAVESVTASGSDTVVARAYYFGLHAQELGLPPPN